MDYLSPCLLIKADGMEKVKIMDLCCSDLTGYHSSPKKGGGIVEHCISLCFIH